MKSLFDCIIVLSINKSRAIFKFTSLCVFTFGSTLQITLLWTQVNKPDKALKHVFFFQGKMVKAHGSGDQRWIKGGLHHGALSYGKNDDLIGCVCVC